MSKTANNDPYRIKARAADIGIKMKELFAKLKDEENLSILYSQFVRARANDVKTHRDLEILRAADRILTKLESEGV